MGHGRDALLYREVESLEEARAIIGAFIERYNHEWLIERLDHRAPVVARQELLVAA